MSMRKISAMVIAALVAGVVLGTMGIANAVPAGAPAAASSMNCAPGECGQQKAATCPSSGDCAQQGAAQGQCGSMSGACGANQ